MSWIYWIWNFSDIYLIYALNSFPLSYGLKEVFLRVTNVLSSEYRVWARASYPIGRTYSVISSMLKFGEMDNEQNSLIRISLISLKSGKEVIPSRFT